MAELVGKRYATALYEAAVETKSLDKVYEELTEVSSLYEEVKDLKVLLEHPGLSKLEKKKALDGIFKDKISDMMLHFLYILVDKGREKHLGEMKAAFEEYYLEAKDRTKVEVITAVPLSEEQKEALKKVLAQNLNQQIELIHHVEKDVLGGMLLKLKGQVMDGTVPGMLRKLEQQLTASRL